MTKQDDKRRYLAVAPGGWGRAKTEREAILEAAKHSRGRAKKAPFEVYETVHGAHVDGLGRICAPASGPEPFLVNTGTITERNRRGKRTWEIAYTKDEIEGAE